jgi:hypothetical protein
MSNIDEKRNCCKEVEVVGIWSDMYSDNLNTTQTLEYTKDKHNVKIKK